MIKAKKSLGQNFLIDKNIINKIISICNITKEDKILEIGAGYGYLTEEIEKLKPKKIYAIEKDEKIANNIIKKFEKSKNINVINEDILKILKKKSLDKNLIIFGNLPYNISSQILASLILLGKWPPWYKKMIFMFQEEVAKRILAKSGSKEYGRLSILANWRLEVKKHFNVSKNCFSPSPKVNSTILSFTPIKKYKYKLKNPKNLEMITRILFSNRRKMLNKNFKKLFKNHDAISKKLKINLTKRPEEINSDTFYKIAIEYEALLG